MAPKPLIQRDQPAVLCRAFKKESYAQAMLAGSVRMGQLGLYRRIEDRNRADANEGTSVLRTPFEYDPSKLIRHSSGPVTNVTFLLCTFGPEADLERMKSRFGSHVVQINDPERLRLELETYFRSVNDEAMRRPVELVA